MAERPQLTTDSGMPVSDNQNSTTAGPRGPVLMQDFILFEKLPTRTASASLNVASTPRVRAPTAR